MKYKDMPTEVQVAVVNSLKEIVAKQDVLMTKNASAQQKIQFKEFAKNILAGFGYLIK